MHIHKFKKICLLKQFIVLCASYFLFVACNETVEPDTSGFGYEYYPMEINDFRIYHTTTIRYNLNGTIDTARYLVKELAEELITFEDGSSRMLLGRYSADIGSVNWEKDSLWAVNVNNTKVEVSEATLDFIKLVFPVKDALTWDGNAHNALDEEFYEIKDLGKPYSYDTLAYENTLTVVHQDLIDPAKITEDDYRIEIFAFEKGLIYKLKIRINYCSTCVENGKIEDGYIFEQKLIEIGKE